MDNRTLIILCNDAKLPDALRKKRNKKVITLNYDKNDDNTIINVGLPKFVDDVRHLPNNVKDLLEIAAYVYAGDRKISRGAIDQVEYQSWSRNLHYVIKVQDIEFWNNIEVKSSLKKALEFVSGDKKYEFTFESGRPTNKYNLFDENEFKIQTKRKTNIILFSGGLDSLAGVLETLSNSINDVCLVSHKSSSGSSSSARNRILAELNKKFPNRCKYYEFKCNLSGIRGVDESQRTRSFLYSSIAFALSTAYSTNNIYYYENGITSINFMDSQDLINARASRTTHPKTIGLFNKFFQQFNNKFVIQFPYLYHTKSDVIGIIKQIDLIDYIRISVSCSKIFKDIGEHTHCGGCSQCIDRKIAIYDLGLEEFDDRLGLYSIDFIKDNITDLSIRKTLLDYIRLALDFFEMDINTFYYKMVETLAEIDEFIEGESEEEKVQKIFKLCKKHGSQVKNAVNRMSSIYIDLFKRNNLNQDSLLGLLNAGVHFKVPSIQLAEKIISKLESSIPKTFQKNKPKNENDFNDKVEGLIDSEKYDYEREFPSIKFALCKTIPDHSILHNDLLIESKYLRGKISPSSITDEISSDILKYNKNTVNKYILFVIYDPERKIKDDQKFCNEFSDYNCIIKIIR